MTTSLHVLTVAAVYSKNDTTTALSLYHPILKKSFPPNRVKRKKASVYPIQDSGRIIQGLGQPNASPTL